MEKLQEAAEEYFMKYTDIISMAGTKEKVVKAMVGFATIQQQQSKEVIEELVKALEDSIQYHPFYLKKQAYSELIQKHRNNNP